MPLSILKKDMGFQFEEISSYGQILGLIWTFYGGKRPFFGKKGNFNFRKNPNLAFYTKPITFLCNKWRFLSIFENFNYGHIFGVRPKFSILGNLQLWTSFWPNLNFLRGKRPFFGKKGNFNFRKNLNLAFYSKPRTFICNKWWFLSIFENLNYGHIFGVIWTFNGGKMPFFGKKGSF